PPPRPPTPPLFPYTTLFRSQNRHHFLGDESHSSRRWQDDGRREPHRSIKGVAHGIDICLQLGHDGRTQHVHGGGDLGGGQQRDLLGHRVKPDNVDLARHFADDQRIGPLPQRPHHFHA